MVDVEHEQRERLTGPPGGQVRRDQVRALTPVPHAGEGVGDGEVVQRGLRGLAVTDIAGDPDQLHDLPGAIDVRNDLQFAGHDRSVPAVILLLAAEDRRLCAGLDRGKQPLVVVGANGR